MKNNMSENTKKIVTRFAPSPTGFLHSGNYRTAIFSYLYARHTGGKFILRIEDTDKERSKKEYADNILESLAWIGLDYDNADSIPKQSERGELYKKYLQKLIDENKAYISKEEIKKEGDRAEVIRFRNPNKVVTFKDMIRGDISMNTTDLGDFVIAKSLDEPVFHIAVVVDDFDMGITHVVRGEDHISNTPRQILIQEAIGATTPEYAHLPLVLSPDRTKLSKRKGALALTEYRDQGFQPEAVLNYITFLGWNPGGEKEIYSISELINEFDLAKVQKSAAIFNTEKLLWFNKEYIKRLPADRLTQEISDKLKVKYTFTDEILGKVLNIITERINTFGELEKYVAEGEFDYFFLAPEPKKEMLIWKKDTDFEIPKKNLQLISEMIKNIAETDFTEEKLKQILMPKADELGKGSVLWPIRVSLSGKDKSPDPFTLLSILGKTESLNRIQTAIKVL
jgi:glutamyl-tRNA synthetase